MTLGCNSFTIAISDPSRYVQGTSDDCHRYDFSGMFYGTDLLFSNFFYLFGIDHNPPCSLCSHDLCLFPFSMFLLSHDYMAKRSHYRIMIFLTSEYYSMDAPPPSFSSTSSITPPPLYSPSRSNNNSPTWRRIPPGREVWSSGKSQLYWGGLSSLQTRHCQGQMGPSIKEVSTAVDRKSVV